MIPTLEWIFSVSKGNIEWNNELIENYRLQYSNENILDGLQIREPYAGGSVDILKAVLKYGISNKNVAVLGSLICNPSKIFSLEYCNL